MPGQERKERKKKEEENQKPLSKKKYGLRARTTNSLLSSIRSKAPLIVLNIFSVARKAAILFSFYRLLRYPTNRSYFIEKKGKRNGGCGCGWG